MSRTLTREDGIAAVYGGGVLGGGGGGHLADGLARVEQIFDGHLPAPTLVSLDEMSPLATVACVALVGAPSAAAAHIDEAQLIASVRELAGAVEGELAALMTNENGPATTINGWLQAAALGLPVLDAPSNGRAHPTGVMGALQLQKEPEYTSVQAFAGGAGTAALTGHVAGSLNTAAAAVRALSVTAGGMVGVCRNPVSIQRVREYGAAGGIGFAIDLGRAHLAGTTGAEKIANVVDFLGGNVCFTGTVDGVELRQEGGFDVGTVTLGDGSRNCELSFWNEYMTAEIAGERLATFPDLIMTLDTETGAPIVSARIEEGQSVTVITADKSRLRLGASMFDADLLAGIEPVLGKPIVAHQ
jgi:DUF917 family protein